MAAADGRLLGAVGLIDRHDAARAEVGYWVAPWARGRGVAGRALALISRWALGPSGSPAASTSTPRWRTPPPCGSPSAAGTCARALRKAWFRGPAREDLAVYSLLVEDLGG